MIETEDKTTQKWNILFVGWLIALVSTLGAIFIGEVMGKVPCDLCWYQRILMFPLPVLLGVALYCRDFSIWRYALPLSVGGVLVSAFHSLLYLKIIPEEIKPCTETGPSCSGADMLLWGIVPLPLLSLLAFLVISLTLITLRKKG